MSCLHRWSTHEYCSLCDLAFDLYKIPHLVQIAFGMTTPAQEEAAV